jgi:cob(I)alamin adenosyltransferase
MSVGRWMASESRVDYFGLEIEPLNLFQIGLKTRNRSSHTVCRWIVYRAERVRMRDRVIYLNIPKCNLLFICLLECGPY